MEQKEFLNTFTGVKTPGASDDDAQLHPVTLIHPFKKIALALSGGGFRASSFSIGSMSYLAQVKSATLESGESNLLDNVEFISSASGGTFTGIFYATQAIKGIPFVDIYHKIILFMKGETLLQDALEVVNDETQWIGSSKTRNFINAFAKIYDKKLFEGDLFGLFWQNRDSTTIQKNIEVCFNATELYRGLSFRFQVVESVGNTSTTHGKTGNRYIFFDNLSKTNQGVLKNIKLGDIMAASSCFPGAFEPMMYPEDFTYSPEKFDKGLQVDELRRAMIITDYDGKEQVLNTSFGMMDGGIDDNQGLYSAMLADKRRRKDDPNNGFDLIMITDVDSYFMDPFLSPVDVISTNPQSKNFGTLLKRLRTAYTDLARGVKWVAIISFLMLIAAVLIIVYAEQDKLRNIGFLLLSPSILLLLLIAFIMGFKAGNPFVKALTKWLCAEDDEIISNIKKVIPTIGGFSNNTVKLLLNYFEKSPLAVLDQMLKVRINSLLSIVLDINLKQTRRLIFDVFYGSFYGKNIWENRRIFNVIYELSTFNKISRTITLQKKFEASHNSIDPNDNWSNDCIQLLTTNCAEINTIAESARTMNTTLWYESKDIDRMKDVIACGQFTACCKLLEYALITARIIDNESGKPIDQKTILFNDADMALFLQIKMQLQNDWEKFKVKPYYLYEEYEKHRKDLINNN